MAQSVSAVLLSLKGAAGFQLDMKYNKRGNQATLAWPVASILGNFFNKLNWFQDILSLIAYLIAFIGALIIFATLRTAMNERKREFAILRCLGASRQLLTSTILLQSMIISLFGILGTCMAYFLINSFATSVIREQSGVLMKGVDFDQVSVLSLIHI